MDVECLSAEPGAGQLITAGLASLLQGSPGFAFQSAGITDSFCALSIYLHGC